MVLYCLVLFLAFDFAYSTFTRRQEQARAARISDPVYDHSLAPKFDGLDVWGESRAGCSRTASVSRMLRRATFRCTRTHAAFS
jgi:hypothetical protein